MTDEKFNGWTNYETWLMKLNLRSEEGIYNEIVEITKNEEDNYRLGENLKSFVEEAFYVEEYGIYKICDAWTVRDFQKINWTEIAESLKLASLREE